MTLITFDDGGYEFTMIIPGHHDRNAVKDFVARIGARPASARLEKASRALVGQRGAGGTGVGQADFQAAGNVGENHAPLQISSRAEVGHTVPLVTSEPCPTRVSPFRGNPVGQPATTRRRSSAERVEAYRETLKALAQEKTELMPDADAHTAALKDARGRLAASHEAFRPCPGDCSPTETAKRLALHDRILAASERWGKQARRYREVNTLMAALAQDIERLEKAIAR